MKTKISPAVVGAFVLGAFALGVISLLAFGSLSFLTRPERFMCRVSARRAASICRAVTRSGSSALSPN